ncbi:lipase maturation factor 2b [Triplophysa dalaica]|uniref:lipase maturation factor 2b n=1 Tax=Triplophysa dalaica TaxID=1582913 RepID=UPI0024E015B8|nr:lipase maturation factor 2b [Triplophysa dalaica]
MGEVKTPRQMFLWSLALIYVCAFASVYIQIPGLYGDDGLIPVRLLMPKVQRPLLEQFQASPSLLWLAPSLGLEPHHALELICVLGVVLSLGAVLLGLLRDSLVYLCLWALYLSIYNVGGDFLSSEWDMLLLEAGFLAVLVAPFGLLRGCSVYRIHDPVTFWLTRWLFFRLTFCTGVSKLASGDPAWWNLSALTHHFENQMSPTPLAWYVHQLPEWLLKFEAVVLLHCEIVVPLLMFFAPIRRLRLVGFYIQLFLQVGHILTGNCSLLNLLTIALSFSLLDDDHFSSSTAQKKKKKTRTWMPSLDSILVLLVELSVYVLILFSEVKLFKLQINWEEKTLSSQTDFTKKEFDEYLESIHVATIWVAVLSFTWEAVAAMLQCVCTSGVMSKLWSLLQWTVMTAAAVSIFSFSLVPYTAITGSNVFPMVREAYSAVEKYQLVGAYGIQHRVTSVEGRPEIILEGSQDGLIWKEINLMYKPGSVNAAPPIAGAHQPRLEWVMWQAAQGGHNESAWFTGLVHRLLQGRPQVVGLLQADEAQYPFSKKPPTFIKANIHKYHFTDPAEDKSNPKAWWRRSGHTKFLPIVKLDDPALKNMLEQSGLKEEFPIQPSSDTPVSQALGLMREQVKGLSGSLVISTLLATLAGIFLVKAVLSWAFGGRKPKSATADHKSKKESAEKSHGVSASSRGNKKDNSEDRKLDSERSPRKRK